MVDFPRAKYRARRAARARRRVRYLRNAASRQKQASILIFTFLVNFYSASLVEDTRKLFKRCCRNSQNKPLRKDCRAILLNKGSDWTKWNEEGFLSYKLFMHFSPGSKWDLLDSAASGAAAASVEDLFGGRTKRMIDILVKNKKFVPVVGGFQVPLMLDSYRMHKSWAILTPLSEDQWDRGDGKVACFYKNGVQEQFFNDIISDIKNRLCQ